MSCSTPHPHRTLPTQATAYYLLAADWGQARGGGAAGWTEPLAGVPGGRFWAWRALREAGVPFDELYRAYAGLVDSASPLAACQDLHLMGAALDCAGGWAAAVAASRHANPAAVAAELDLLRASLRDPGAGGLKALAGRVQGRAPALSLGAGTGADAARTRLLQGLQVGGAEGGGSGGVSANGFGGWACWWVG